jgi:hypothetical protein
MMSVRSSTEMYIDRNIKSSCTPFGEAQINERCSLQDALRFPERSRRTGVSAGHKHLNPIGMKNHSSVKWWSCQPTNPNAG